MVRGNVRCSCYRLIGKLVVDFLLVIIELFSLGAFVLSQYTRLTDRQNLYRNTVRMLRSRTVKMVRFLSIIFLLNKTDDDNDDDDGDDDDELMMMMMMMMIVV